MEIKQVKSIPSAHRRSKSRIRTIIDAAKSSETGIIAIECQGNELDVLRTSIRQVNRNEHTGIKMVQRGSTAYFVDEERAADALGA